MQDSQAIATTEVLVQCMLQRRDILLTLRNLTDSLAETSRAADVNVTLGILARKEAVLEELAVVREQLRPFHSDDPQQRQWSSPARRQFCRQLADEGDRLLTESMQLEQSILSEMTGKRDAIAAQLQNGKDSILATNAYTAGEVLGASSLDLSNL